MHAMGEALRMAVEAKVREKADHRERVTRSVAVDRTTKGLVAKCGAVDHVGVHGEVAIKARVSIVPNGGRRRDSVGNAERDLVGVV